MPEASKMLFNPKFTKLQVWHLPQTTAQSKQTQQGSVSTDQTEPWCDVFLVTENNSDKTQ